MRWRARSSDLPKNGRISDFAIRGQQERFAQDDGKRLVPIEREVKGSPPPRFGRNAEVPNPQFVWSLYYLRCVWQPPACFVSCS